MKFVINNTDYNPTFDESYFEVNSIINSTNNKEDNNENNNENNNSKSNETTECDPAKDSNCSTSDSQNKTTPNNTENNATVKPNSYRTTMGINDEKQDENISPTATIEDVIYPLYLPSGTVLKDQEKVSKTDGERVILTFAGDKGFTLVEETATRDEEFTIIPTYGEPGFVNDTIGAITDNSLNWISNGIEYYMVSDVMNVTELLDVANSINVTAVASLK